MSVGISHKGTIIAVGKNTVTVAITTSAEDCDGCAISQLCAKKETVEVYYNNPGKDLIGKHVTIEISPSSQTKAVIIMLAVPIFIMVAAMLISVACGLSEMTSAIISLGGVAIWYLGVYFISKKTFSRQSISISSLDS